MTTVPPSTDGTDPGEDLRFLLQQEQESIRHADTKLALVLTGLAVLASRVISDRDRFVSPAHGDGVRAVLSAGCYYLSLVLLLASFVFLLLGLVPRLTLPVDHLGTGNALPVNRFAWPSVARARLDQLAALDGSTVRLEALTQAMILARITVTKFRMFNASLLTGLLSGLCAALWGISR